MEHESKIPDTIEETAQDGPAVQELPVQAEPAAAAEPEAAGEAGAAQPEPEQAKSEEELLREKLGELEDRHLRLLAEYDNFRKRSAREKDEIYANATAVVLERFLPIQDNFERAAAFDKTGEDFAKGFDMILDSFRQLLDSFGVEEIGRVGEPFDPAVHNAVMHVEDESLGENVVAQVLQKGYKIGERVLRYAMVQTAN